MMEWERIRKIEDRLEIIDIMIEKIIGFMEKQANINSNICSVLNKTVDDADTVSDKS